MIQLGNSILVILLGAITSLTFASKAFADIGDDLRATLEEQLVLSEREDLAGVMALMHTDSPIYRTQQKIINQISAAYDLQYELLDFNYIGKDAEFTYARSTLRTTRVSGPAFRNNVLEAVAIFKQENGQWRFWNQANLRVIFQ